MEKINKCLKCGKKFSEGELKYKINMVIASDFDGVLGETEEEAEVDELMEEIESKEPEELEEEVYKEINFLLCKPCRDVFVRELSDLQIKQIIEDEDLIWQ